MSTGRRRALILGLIVAVASTARAADESAVVVRATRLLEEIASGPESGIPVGELREAAGILIVPHIVEMRLGMGRKKGHGVFLSRDERGDWGNPQPFEISGHSLGADVGRDVTDVVVIYRTRKAAREFGERRLTLSLGLEASGTLRGRRPFRRRPSPADNKDILIYARHHGVILGASFSGERRWGATSATAEAKSAGGPKASETAPAARWVDSPESARLKAILAAITARPAAAAARAGVRDTSVRPAGGSAGAGDAVAPAR